MNGTRTSESPLRPGDLEEAAARLSAEADRLRSELARAREAESALRADCDLDAADTDAKAMTLNELRTRAESDEALLERTVAALDRLRGGSFGICTRCGRPQGRERAMALPHAELCVLCAEAREAAGPDG
ncbi:TraR/DksA C4-type zinc finger protein [Streptomyces sp. RKCA744]|uniref:TraR/DksA family transcriptional regulator n=1 Tax=Streptomyces sp. RKCA744 TaxID=2959340 RepID=UPI0020A186B3|nr:TraR/DksA C4-type zinc finger protein [Streptomyces sp. RKCA744]MCO8305435.1 TraR/DksA C4-type zinc finger protein [Streptomyces sp. RKCA744]